MPSISLCMIVKNEAKTLANCLNCAKKFVDEIIVVDTGSKDNTIEIAKEFTEKVYNFDWVNDFSAARNFSFSKATMDYILWLDADDVISDENIDAFLSIKENLPSDVDAVMLPYNVGFDDNGNINFSYYRERLVKRANNFVWKEPVHEYIEVGGNIVKLDAAVTHNKQETALSQRNIFIYKSILKRGEELSTRGKYYFARELKTHGQLKQAVKLYKAFQKAGDGWIEDKLSVACELADCYVELGLNDKALDELQASFELGVPRAGALIRIAQIYMTRGDLRSAVFWYECALHTPRPEGWGFVVADEWGYIPHMQLAMLYDRLSETQTAFLHHLSVKALKPDDVRVAYNSEYFASIGLK